MTRSKPGTIGAVCSPFWARRVLQGRRDLGEIKLVGVRQHGALRGIRLVAYDFVLDYIRRTAESVDAGAKVQP